MRALNHTSGCGWVLNHNRLSLVLVVLFLFFLILPARQYGLLSPSSRPFNYSTTHFPLFRNKYMQFPTKLFSTYYALSQSDECVSLSGRLSLFPVPIPVTHSSLSSLGFCPLLRLGSGQGLSPFLCQILFVLLKGKLRHFKHLKSLFGQKLIHL